MSKQISFDMNPKGLTFRESCDSEEHPESLAIIVGLDETGSMGIVPHELVKEGLPNMVGKLQDKGINDPQILFLGIGDHLSDNAPLQVGQFESSDELMDKWLTEIYLEGKGGGNKGESYLLAWYLAAYHTKIDCLEKRNQKGFLFTIGDEPCHDCIGKLWIHENIGLQGKEFPDLIKASDLLNEAKKYYYVYHIAIPYAFMNRGYTDEKGWRNLLNENYIQVDDYKKIPEIIAKTINSHSIKTDNLKDGMISNKGIML